MGHFWDAKKAASFTNGLRKSYTFLSNAAAQDLSGATSRCHGSRFFQRLTEVEVGQHLRVREDGIGLAAFLVIYLEMDVWPNLSLFVCLARKPSTQKL